MSDRLISGASTAAGAGFFCSQLLPDKAINKTRKTPQTGRLVKNGASVELHSRQYAKAFNDDGKGIDRTFPPQARRLADFSRPSLR
jgi:hypothetical protein